MGINESIPCTSFGLNSIPEDKLEEFRDKVNEYGSCSASWSCTGRTLHQILAHQLSDKCPEFDFDIGYNYHCVAYKRV